MIGPVPELLRPRDASDPGRRPRAALGGDAADERNEAGRASGGPDRGREKDGVLRVVIPGLTGLPIRPGNLTCTQGFATRASRPPTKPSGQPSSQTAVPTRAGGTGAGTTTHGPAMGLQIVSPSQTRGGACGPRRAGDADARQPRARRAASTRLMAPSAARSAESDRAGEQEAERAEPERERELLLLRRLADPRLELRQDGLQVGGARPDVEATVRELGDLLHLGRVGRDADELHEPAHPRDADDPVRAADEDGVDRYVQLDCALQRVRRGHLTALLETVGEEDHRSGRDIAGLPLLPPRLARYGAAHVERGDDPVAERGPSARGQLLERLLNELAVPGRGRGDTRLGGEVDDPDAVLRRAGPSRTRARPA